MFQLARITLHSGKTSEFKIECDSITESDWATLAYLASRIVGEFSSVYGVPMGGIPFADAMEKYVSDKGPRLIVDDVLTTGGSMVEVMDQSCVGLVAFARGKCPAGVKAVFYMNELAEDAKEGLSYD